MSNIKKTFFCFITISFLTLAQDAVDSLNINPQSAQLNKHFSSSLDDLDFYLDLQNLNKTFLLNNDPNTKWLWTSYAISNSSQETFHSEFNLDNITHPLYQKYLEDSKFNPFRYALGMMQVGAVGYLAYKHIKKYGFLKK
jgi:hypothetical protein